MSEPTPNYEVQCDDCERTVTKESKDAAQSLVDSHKDRQHNGEKIARLVGEHDPLTSFVDILNDVNTKSRLTLARYNTHLCRIACPECEVASIETEKESIEEKLQLHNTIEHNGDTVAGVFKEDIDGTTANRRKPLPNKDTKDAVDVLADFCDEDEIVTPPHIDDLITQDVKSEIS